MFATLLYRMFFDQKPLSSGGSVLLRLRGWVPLPSSVARWRRMCLVLRAGPAAPTSSGSASISPSRPVTPSLAASATPRWLSSRVPAGRVCSCGSGRAGTQPLAGGLRWPPWWHCDQPRPRPARSVVLLPFQACVVSCVVHLCPPPPNNRIISCTFMTK